MFVLPKDQSVKPQSYSGSLPDNYDQQKKMEDTGELMVNGHKYVLNPNGATIDGVQINGLKLAINQGKLYINDGNGYYKMYEGSEQQKIIEGTVVKKDQPSLPSLPAPNDPSIIFPQNKPVVEQISQVVPLDRPVDTSQLTMLKFPEKSTLFEKPESLIFLGLIGLGVWQYLKK